MTLFFTFIISLFNFYSPMNDFLKTSLEEPKELEWNKTTHDFGDIIQGTKSKYTFTFTNKGTVAVNITNASASCGCTVPSYSKEPIEPGNQGTITVIFDSAGKENFFVKTVTVATTVGTSYLTIKGNIIKQVEKPKSPIQID